jgi:saccharopine dehydrogenase (NAD+, L-lysine-forming)
MGAPSLCHSEIPFCVRLSRMEVLVVGAGGVGAAFAAIAERRDAFARVVLADLAPERAQAVVDRLGEPDRFAAERVDASSEGALVELIGRVKPDAVLNACDPRFNEPIFGAAFNAKTTYLDLAMTLSHPHPERPLRAAEAKGRDPQNVNAKLYISYNGFRAC